MMKPDGALAALETSTDRARKTRVEAACGAPTPCAVTTSWDDGSPLDLRIADLLAERELPGTFYVPVKGHTRSVRMRSSEMLQLARQGFEIGAHGISHPNLAECEPWRLAIEVEISKKKLEDALGKRVLMFAYPRGRYNSEVVSAVKEAGFIGARTTSMLSCDLAFDPFRMPTSVQAYPHSRLDYMRNLSRVVDWRRTWVYATHVRYASNWVALAKILFDSVLRDGGLWHIYGHSWEVEEYDLWDDLREVLAYVSNRSGVLYLGNGEIAKFCVDRSWIPSLASAQ
jgi:peptidoglycan-N-acetylglucosamine deacetylase